MALVLSFVKLPAGVNLPTMTHSFDESGGSIGRGDGNELTLPDPDRFLSSKHCQISCEGGQYYVSDTSTNGTFVNGGHEALGRGGKFALNSGSTLELGDYQFEVSVGGQAALDIPAANPSFADPLDDPFAADVFASPSPPASMAPPIEDDPFSSAFELDDFASISPSLKPEGADIFASSSFDFDDDPFGAPLPDKSASSSSSADPLAALDGANYGGSPLTGQHSHEARVSGIDDFLGAAPATSSHEFSGKTLGDNLDPLGQSMSWPASGSSVIPDDWDDLLGVDEPAPIPAAIPPIPAAMPPVTARQAPARPVVEPPSVQNLPDDDWGSFDDEFPQPAMPLGSPAPSSKPAASSPVSADDLGIVDNFNDQAGGFFDGKATDAHRSMPLTEPPKWPETNRPDAPVAPPAQAPRSAPVNANTSNANTSNASTSRPASAPGNTVGSRDESLTNELLTRMGLSPSNLDDAQKDDICLAFADLVPVVVTGMMQVLRSRASIKNEFRMNVTTIQPVENNPLKFSATAAEAMEKMFVHSTSAYKRPVEAFQEGFDGISEHQVAIIAGIRAAFKSIMDGFSPAVLEKQFERQGKGLGLPGMQKARYWNSYVDYYQSSIDNMETSFQHLFGDEFVDAYEEQLRTLAAERKKKQF